MAEKDSARVRRYQPADLGDVYHVCLLTAGNGQDGTALFRDPRLPGELYAVPYALLEPSLAFVAEDSAGVGGYVVAALDYLAFVRRVEEEWLPVLRERYPEPSPEVASELSVQEQRALRTIHHGWPVEADLARRYPSHLHINLLPRMQGRGIGRQLIDTLTADLRHQGSGGLHLTVSPANERAVAFYRHIGFSELPASEVLLFGMTPEQFSPRARV